MSTLFKGLTRPALIRGLGVPLYPFLGMCIIWGLRANGTKTYVYGITY